MSIVSTFTHELGNFTITIADGGSASTAFATKIGTIKYDFDIVNEENTITSKIVAYNTFDFSMIAFDAVGDNLYDRLFTALASVNATVTFQVDTFSGETWYFTFLLKQSGLSYDRLTKIVSFKCTTFPIPSLTVLDVFTAVTNFTFQDGDGDTDAISVGSFIDYTISSFNTSLSTNFLNLAPTGSASYSTSLYELYTNPNTELSGTQIALCLKYNATFDDFLAVQILSFLSILEGGFFGTGFDANFYVNRTAQGTAVEVSENNLLKYSVVPRNPVFSSLNLTSGASGNLIPTAIEFENTIIASKTLNINSEVNMLHKGERVVGSPPRLNGIYTGYDIADIEPILVQSGLDGIKESYPANVTKVIEAEIKDCTKMKVYDSFYFADTPSEVFRLSYAEYDLIKNEVKIKAYQI